MPGNSEGPAFASPSALSVQAYSVATYAVTSIVTATTSASGLVHFIWHPPD